MSDSLKPPQTEACWAPLSSTSSWSLLKLMSIESVMVYNHLILCQPIPSCAQSFPASGSFPISLPFASGGQSTEASATVLLMNGWFPLSSLVWFPCGSRSLALISWLQSLSTVIWNPPKKKKSVTASSFSPSICHGVTGPDARILEKKLETIYLFYVISVCQMVAHVT